MSLNRQAIARLVAALALVAASAISIGSGVSSVQAANPVEFNAAAVTPANVASFMALSLDRTDPQYVQAQVLLARIMGVDPADMEDEASLDSMLPAELGDLPELENGQAAFIIQQQDLGSLVMAGMLAPPMLGGMSDDDSLDDAASVLESIPTDQLQGMTVVLTADNIDEVGARLLADLQEVASAHDTPVVTVETVNGSVISTVGVGESVQLDDFEFSAIAQVEGAIVLGFSEDGVLPFVATAEGDAPPLSESSDYQAAMAALPPEVLFASYAQGITAEQIDNIQAAVAQAAGYPMALDLIIDPTGPTGFAVIAADEGFRIESATLSAGGDLASPVPAATNELTLDQHVPSDTMIFANGHDLGASQAMRAVEQLVLILLAGASGDTTGLEILTESSIAQQFAGLEMLLGFNAQTDLIQQLQGEYGLVVSSFDLLDPMGFGALFVSGVADGDVVDQALTQLALLTQVMGEDVPPVTNVTVGDADVSQMIFDVDGMEVPVQFGVIDDRLLLSVGPALANFVLGPSSSLAENPAYAEAMGYLPAAEDGIYFVNMPEIVDLAMLGMGLFVSESSSSTSFEAAPAPSADSDAVTDAAVRCGEFADQAAAQEAYDSDPVANFDLDFDFDGEACDDYFVDATDVSVSADDDIFGDLTLDLQVNIGGLAIVTYDDGDMHRMSGILVVPTDE